MYVLKLEWRLAVCDPMICTMDRRKLLMKCLTGIQTEFKLLTETKTATLNERGKSYTSRLRDCYFESFAKET